MHKLTRVMSSNRGSKIEWMLNPQSEQDFNHSFKVLFNYLITSDYEDLDKWLLKNCEACTFIIENKNFISFKREWKKG